MGRGQADVLLERVGLAPDVLELEQELVRPEIMVLLGATAALPVWGEMMAALEPEPVDFPRPESIVQAMIDPQSGLLADASCPGAIELPFVKGSAPQARAPCAGNPVMDNVKGFFQRLLGQ